MIIGEAALVGRESERQTLARALHADPPRSVVVAGPAGIGKTRLLTAATMTTSDLRRVRASKAGSGHDLLAIAPLLPDDAPTSALHAARMIQRSFGDQADAVVVIDDLQWLDPASSAVVQLAVSEGWFSVLGSLRSTEPAPDAVTALWKDGLAERIDLGPLDRAELDELARLLLGAPLDGHASRALWMASAGNPLHAREWLRAAQDSGRLSDANGVLALRGSMLGPSRLTELLRARLDALSEEVRELGALLAIADGMPVDALAALSSPEAVYAAERAQLVILSDDQRVWFTHPLMAEAALAPMTGAQRLVFTRRVAGELVARDGAPRDVVRGTLMLLESGVDIPADELLATASTAGVLGDLSSFRALATAAADHGSARGYLLLGEMAARAVDREAEPLLRSAIERASDFADRQAATRALAFHLAGTGRGGEGLALLEHSWEGLEPEVVEGRRAMCAMVPLLARGPVAALDALGDWAPSTFIEHLNTRWTRALATALLGRADDTETAIREFESWVTTVPSGGRMPLGILAYLALADTDAGRFAAAERAGRASYDAAITAGDREDQATAALMLGRLGVLRGQLDDADRWFRESGAASHVFGDQLALRWALGGQLLVASWRRDLDACAELSERIASIGLSPSLLDLELVDRATAWATIVTGQRSAGRARLAAAAAAARAQGLPVAELRLLHDLARTVPLERRAELTATADVATRVEELASTQHGSLPALIARHVRALAEADAGALRSVAADLEPLGARLLAAEALGAAAAIAERAQDRAGAYGDRQRMGALLPTLHGAATPALQIDPTVTVLTRREREIAELAARGLASKEIAGLLFVSPRTVDNSLGRVFTKLGISSRRDLADALA